MARIPLFNSPLMLGFEQFERTLDRVSKSAADGYPPYNIEQTSDESLRITLAVAGFAESDLSIRLEDNQLVIQGRQAEDDDRVYLHRGIAGRQFQRTAAHRAQAASAEDPGPHHRDRLAPVPPEGMTGGPAEACTVLPPLSY